MKNILFIGNSYIYYNDMPTALFGKMAASAGIDVKITSITKGGESLVGHSTEGHETYKRINDTLEGERFDFVILQDQSDTPAIWKDKYFIGLDYFVDKARKNGAQVVLYGTWPKQAGHKNLEKFRITKEEMARMLDTSFAEAGEKYGARVGYVGLCFAEMEKNSVLPTPYDPDLSHPSYAGSYAAAFCLLNTVFNVDADSVTFCGELSDEQADAIKRIVKSIS
jgi:hypothetical protein